MEDSRLKQINSDALVIFEKLLLDYEQETLQVDTILATTYAHLVMCYVIGYRVESLAEEAAKHGKMLLEVVQSAED
jgi:hypothetical protein